MSEFVLNKFCLAASAGGRLVGRCCRCLQNSSEFGSGKFERTKFCSRSPRLVDTIVMWGLSLEAILKEGINCPLSFPDFWPGTTQQPSSSPRWTPTTQRIDRRHERNPIQLTKVVKIRKDGAISQPGTTNIYPDSVMFGISCVCEGNEQQQ